MHLRLMAVLVALPLAAQDAPKLAWSAYLGQAGSERVSKPVVDSAGNIYITGRALSGLPVHATAYQSTFGGGQCGVSDPRFPMLYGCGDAFVLKLSPDGARVLGATYIGGSSEDYGQQVGVDAKGNVYVLGTSPTVTATPGAYAMSGIDQFVAKFDPTLSQLLYLTRLVDRAQSMAVDAAGYVYLTGGRKNDAYVLKITPDGSSAAYQFTFGGSDSDGGLNIVVDEVGAAYVTGSTHSIDFPFSATAYSKALGSYGTFIAKVNPGGTALEGATYFPAGITDIALDRDHNVYVTGVAVEGLPVTSGAFQSGYKGGLADTVAVKLDAALSKLVYATYIGGSNYDLANGIAVDPAGNATITGYTKSADWPLASPVQSVLHGTADAFVATLNAGGTALKFSTFLGGFGADEANGVAVDAQGAIVVRGCAGDICLTPIIALNTVSTADSRAFPITPGAFAQDTAHRGSYVLKLSPATTNAPVMFVNGIANAASLETKPLAPGELVAILGTRLSTGTQQFSLDSTGRVPTSLAGVRVLFDGVAAPLLYVSPDQINAIVPFGVSTTGPVNVTIERATGVPYSTAAASPGIFCNGAAVFTSCHGSILNEDGTVNSRDNPARKGSVVAMYGTGLGQWSPAVADGSVVSAPPYPSAATKPAATVGGSSAEVLYAGAAPGTVAGVNQVNIRLPANAAGDEVPVILATGDVASPAVAISIR